MFGIHRRQTDFDRKCSPGSGDLTLTDKSFIIFCDLSLIFWGIKHFWDADNLSKPTRRIASIGGSNRRNMAGILAIRRKAQNNPSIQGGGGVRKSINTLTAGQVGPLHKRFKQKFPECFPSVSVI